MGHLAQHGLLLQGIDHLFTPRLCTCLMTRVIFPDATTQVLNEEQQKLARMNEYNFDHPEAYDIDLLIETLGKLKRGKRVEVPIYNFATHAREKLTVSAL